MAKQLNVNLNFQANTGQAKQSILELQTLLAQIVAKGASLDVDDAQLKKASQAAQELSIHLNNAFNAKTGNFDLSKLDRSLKVSKTNVKDLTVQLLQAGTMGEQAFVKFAQAVAAADRPVISLNNKLTEMFTTLKNTARWQLSSSILHGFMGAVQSAYGYAQDLNASLNNIRIVTGYDTEKMAEFAEEANRAAKALSTTTTAYTDASLIFYQQGLEGSAVTQRADIVTKMSNVTGESAQEVSDYMTAVWNNFDDGSRSLEYYADVMTALGAATASSTDEIAAGLEKFAAVADTVGLSYEYATAALATVTATTRQSADVVGTAFKTLFARIQDLELGKTLDDGTTLGTYAQALDKVGINIKDTSGQLKDMDVILEEMAAKWDTLGEAEQTALAQSVAGVRQYTQLIALMDNWDFMKSNLATVDNSSGALTEQAEIYEESWKAANQRVRASMEAIYKDLIDDEFFIDIANGFSGLLDSVDAFIDGIGGVKGLLFSIGAVFLSVFSRQISPAVEDLKHTISVAFSSAEIQARKMATSMETVFIETANEAKASGVTLTQGSETALNNALMMNQAKYKLQAVEDQLNSTEKQRAEQQISILSALQQETQAIADSIVKQKESIRLTEEEIQLKQDALISESGNGKAFEITGKDRDEEEQELIAARQEAQEAYLQSRTKANKEALDQAKAALNAHRQATEEASFASEKFAERLAETYNREMEATQGNIQASNAIMQASDILSPYEEKLNNIEKAYRNHHSSIPKVQEAVGALRSEIKSVVGDSIPELDKAFDDIAEAGSKNDLTQGLAGLKEALQKAQIPAKDLEKILTQLGQGKSVKAIKAEYQKLNRETSNLSKKTKELEEKQKQLNQAVKNFNPTHAVTGLERITKTAAGLGQVVTVAQSLRAVFKAWGNDDLSFGEKLTTTLMSVGAIIPSVIGAVKNLNTAMSIGNSSILGAIAAHKANVLELQKEAAQHSINTALQRISSAEDKKLAANAAAKLAVKKGLIAESQRETYAEMLLTAAKSGENLEDQKGLVTDGLVMLSKQRTIGAYWEAAKAKLAEMKASAMNAGASAMNASASIMETISKGGAIGAAIAHTAALLGEQLAAWELNAALGPLIIVVLLLVAAIASVVAIGALLVTAFNAIKNSTPEAKLKAAEEEAARMAEELNKAKAAADDLRGSIEKYDTAIDKIKTLTQGTEEWRQAIEEANEVARNLIDEYGDQLAGKYSFNAESGLIEFDEGALDNLQEMADNKVKTAQSQKLMADNSVLLAKQRITNRDAARENNIGGTALKAGAMLGPGVLAQAGHLALGELVFDQAQMAALDNLYEAFYDTGGNITEAAASLDPMTKGVIASLGYTDTQLQEMCEAARANTQALIENNKQIIASNFEDNKEYARSENKAFLNEMLAEDLADETKKFRRQQGSDKNAAKEYAKLMGYDENSVEVKKGKATFLDADGNEVKVSTSTIKDYLAQEDALASLNASMSEYVDKVEDLEAEEKKLAAAYAQGTISYGEYREQIQAYGEELGLTQKEVNSYLNKYASENMVRAGREVTLAESIGSMGYSEEEAYRFVDAFAKDLTNEQLEMAINVAATSDSIDEFKREFQHAATDALINSFDATSNLVEEMLKTADENGKFSKEDFAALEQDENFVKWLEEQSMTMQDIVHSNYTEQYNIISSFYSDLRNLQHEALTQSIQNYQDDLAEYQAIMDYKLAAEEGNQAEMQAIRDAWGDSIDFEAYLEMDISDVQEKLDEATAMIEEVTNKKYELDLSWDGVDQIEQSFDEMAKFADMMKDDVKKVGNSYQMTAAQGREWMEMYPELFANAKVTTDGLIELSEAEYQQFAAAQKEKRDAAIQAEIDTLQARLVELEAEEEALLRQKHLYETLAAGQIDLESAKAEDLVAMRQSLVDFYIESGLDEAAANRKALEDMGLSQQEYNRLIAESSEDNAANMINSTMTGVTKIKTLFSNLVSKLWGIFTNLGNAIKSIFTGDWSSIGTYMSQAWESAKGAVTGVVNDFNAIRTNTMGNFKLDGSYTKYTTQAEYDEAKNKHLTDAIADLDSKLNVITDSKNSINAQMTYLEALKKQSLDEYGSTDPDEVDGTTEKEEKEKEEREKQQKYKDMAEDLERYHEITRAIEAQDRALDRLAKKKERAFGADKVALMDEEIAALEKQYENYEDQLSAMEAMELIDLNNIVTLFDVDPMINSEGNIDNWSALEKDAIEDLNAARIAYNNSAMTEADEAILEAAEKLYEERMAALEQYEETIDGKNDVIDNMIDTRLAIQDANYEKFTYKMDQNLESMGRDLEYIEFQLSKIEDDFYSAEKAASLMVGTIAELNSGQFGGQMAQYESNLKYLATQQETLIKLHQSKQISDEQYQEGLQKIREEYMSNIESLQELDKTMKEYYENTLSKAKEELEKYTSQMEHQTSVLDHYMSLIELMGKSNDYEMIGEVLEGQVQLAKNNATVSKQWYESRRLAADDLKKQYEDAVKMGASKADLEMLEENWLAAETAANDAQEQMLSDAEAWAEALKAVLENKLSKLGQTLESALTGGYGSFDAMTTSLERVNTLQEGYLTTTNQIYETNKLMRSAQQEIDKSTNSAAKKRLSAFIKETEELQNQSELSEYELKIQQAKYDLLLAEMALEEAQDAKSTVRLQRDSEGNFGYVYTADSSKVTEAQQQLEDAQNKLYNIGLEGANDYAQKYQQTMAEMYDTFAEIQQKNLDKGFKNEEEYHRAMEEAKNHYYKLLQKYSNQYSIALTTDSRVVSEAWTKDFSSMIYDTEKWMDEVDKYVDGASLAFQDWQNAVTGEGGVTSIIGKNIGEVAGKVQEVTDKSDALANTTTKKVIPALDTELKSVENLTGAYARMRDTILDVINKYGLLVKGINDETRPNWNNGSATGGNGLSTGTGDGSNTGNNGSNTDGSTSGTGNGAGGNSLIDAQPYEENSLVVGSSVTVKTTATHFSRDGGNGTKMKSFVPGSTYTVMEIDGEEVRIGRGQVTTGWVKKSDLLGFDTGGYTGSWDGAYGKLALLHQKEMVLNAHDTENLLTSMEVLNKILEMIDLQSLSAQMGGLLSSPGFHNNNSSVIEQQVTIEAHFPGVQDKNEIEEAFNNLINKASQYANRK